MRATTLAVSLASLALAAPPVLAQADYPSRTITMIVGFAAGGPSDTVARLLAQHVSKTLGQQIVVENVGGAGGTIGADRASKAAPDGYTIMQHHAGLPAHVALYSNLKYDPRTSFETIGLINYGPMVLSSRKTLEVGDLKGLLAWLKEKGTAASVGHAGVGSNSYMCSLAVSRLTDAKFGLVPYRGTGPAMNDLVAGQIDVLCDQAITTGPQVDAGTIKAYAITSKERLRTTLKSVPTATEAGAPAFDMVTWNALYAPKGTPQPVVAKLSSALQSFLDDPGTIERFQQTGYEVFAKEMRTPEAQKRFLGEEIERYVAMLKSAGVAATEVK